jgi:N4-gp56 family major capsid protein
MAKTRFVTNDPLSRKKWARDLFRIILPAIEYSTLTGTGPDAAVQINTDLGKGEGDEITFGIKYPLQEEPRVGEEEVEGYEEKLRFKDFKVTIEELNKAVDTGGKMEEQRVPYDLLKEAKDSLAEWWPGWLSTLLINTLVGNSAFRVNGHVFANAINEPDSDHHLIVNGQPNEAAITSADIINLTFLDRLKQKAELMDQEVNGGLKLRPWNIKGKNYYKVLMHNYAFEMLRRDTDVGEWGDLRRNAGKLEVPEVEIEYNGMLISKTERIPRMRPVGSIANAGVYRTVLLGKQAATFAWGGAGESKGTVMAFVPYTKDAKRFTMVRGGAILGVKKTVFDSMDYGIITASSYAEPTQA